MDIVVGRGMNGLENKKAAGGSSLALKGRKEEGPDMQC